LPSTRLIEEAGPRKCGYCQARAHTWAARSCLERVSKTTTIGEIDEGLPKSAAAALQRDPPRPPFGAAEILAAPNESDV